MKEKQTERQEEMPLGLLVFYEWDHPRWERGTKGRRGATAL